MSTSRAPARCWGTSTSPEVGAGTTTLLVPLGSTEQHGPHLPLDTDTRVAIAIAERAATGRAGVAVAPAVAYGASGEHQGFPGTLSIGQRALELLVVELVRSVGPEVERVVLVNGHGGNVEALARAVATLRSEGREARSWSPELQGTDTHAGQAETSMLLALRPDLVRLDRLEAGATEPLAELLPAMRVGGLAAVTENGVLGDPTDASASVGEALLTACVDDLVRTLDEELGR